MAAIIKRRLLSLAKAAGLYQPLDADLTAIAALATTSFGRSLLTLADAAAARTSLLLDGLNYTPTGTGVTNVDSVTPGEANYIRVGSSVFVSFYAAVDATAAGATTTVFALSLPIASALTSARQLSGVGTTAGVWQTVDIEGDATNDRASLRYQSPVTTAIAITGVFGYRIL